MARTARPLTDTEIRQAKPKDKEYSLADGKNLCLRVRTIVSKVWALNYYRPGTKRRAQTEQYANTFESIARKWLTLKEGKVSPAYYDKISGRLEKYIFRKMGRTPIHRATAVAAIEIMQPLANDEKLSSNQLSDWRREFAQNGVKGLSKSAPGPVPSKIADQRLIEQLEKENNKLTRQLDMASDCLDLQKKALTMLDRLRSGSEQ